MWGQASLHRGHLVAPTGGILTSYRKKKTKLKTEPLLSFFQSISVVYVYPAVFHIHSMCLESIKDQLGLCMGSFRGYQKFLTLFKIKLCMFVSSEKVKYQVGDVFGVSNICLEEPFSMFDCQKRLGHCVVSFSVQSDSAMQPGRQGNKTLFSSLASAHLGSIL